MLDADALMAKARAATGLDDFGDPWFMAAFQKVIELVNAEGGLTNADADPVLMPIGALGDAGRQVFALLRRHFPDWLANGLQAIVFVSFLWELGYRAWGPALTIPFALIQGWIFVRTRSLSYVVTVHLLFDAVVFAVLVHAHNPELFAIFPTAP